MAVTENPILGTSSCMHMCICVHVGTPLNTDDSKNHHILLEKILHCIPADHDPQCFVCLFDLIPKFGIADMLRTQLRFGQTDGQTDRQTV